MRYRIGNIWKLRRGKKYVWKLKLPHGYEIYKTRKEAKINSAEMRKITW